MLGRARLESVGAVLANGMEEDPLDQEEALQDQMDSLPYICRFQYEQTAAFLTALLDPVMDAFSHCAPVVLPCDG